MIARSFAHSSPGCEPIGVILTFCASTGNAASKRANAAQAIFMSSLLRSLILGWPVVTRRRILLGQMTAGKVPPFHGAHPKRTLRALGCGRASAVRRGARRYSVFRG